MMHYKTQKKFNLKTVILLSCSVFKATLCNFFTIK